MFQNLILAFAG